MSETQAAPGAPAPKLNAIQVVEREIENFAKQREQAIANVHAVDGAIQAAQHLRQLLVAEANKAENAVKTAARTLVNDVEAIATKVETAVEDAVAAVKDKVVSIDQK